VAPDASAEVVGAKKKGEGSLEKDVDPNAGCQCYMSFTGTANMDGLVWTLEDATDPYVIPPFAFTGVTSGWDEQFNGGGYEPYPSPYFPLAPPDAGCHKFLFLVYGDEALADNAILYTSVRCYDQNGDLATEVFFPFTVEETDNSGGFGLAPGGYVWRLTSCTYLYQTPGEPDPHDCGPSANNK